MTIMSIDASTKSTGLAVFENNNLVHYELITASSTNLIKRIRKIIEGIHQALIQYPVDKIIMEEVLPPSDKDGVQNTKTFKALMYLQAAMAFMLEDFFPNLEIEFLYPSSWRKYCGIKTGPTIKRETLKQSDIKFVNEQFHLEIQSDDVADAIGIGYGYLHCGNTEPKGAINWT